MRSLAKVSSLTGGTPVLLQAQGFATAPAAGAENSTKSLFAKLGGGKAVQAAVDIFYDRMLADDRVNFFFEGVDMRKQRAHQVPPLLAEQLRHTWPSRFSASCQSACFGGASGLPLAPPVPKPPSDWCVTDAWGPSHVLPLGHHDSFQHTLSTGVADAMTAIVLGCPASEGRPCF